MSELVFYNMRQAQEETGLGAPTLRYWEQQFPEFIKPRKDNHGNRTYRQEDIAAIKQIKFIRDEMKITRIEAIRTEMTSRAKHSDQRERAFGILEKVRQELMAIRAKL